MILRTHLLTAVRNYPLVPGTRFPFSSHADPPAHMIPAPSPPGHCHTLHPKEHSVFEIFDAIEIYYTSIYDNISQLVS